MSEQNFEYDSSSALLSSQGEVTQSSEENIIVTKSNKKDHSLPANIKLSRKKSSSNMTRKETIISKVNESSNEFRLPMASSIPNTNIQTQTDWSWVRDKQLLERIRRGQYRTVYSNCLIFD
jgi:hypothetical protein